MRTIKCLKQYQELEEIETVKSDRKCGGTLSCILQNGGNKYIFNDSKARTKFEEKT